MSRGFVPSGGEGARTPDLIHAMDALSQLSYAPLGNEKAILCIPVGRSNRFHHEFYPARRVDSGSGNTRRRRIVV